MATLNLPPWKETHVTDWDSLLAALHAPAMIPRQLDQGGHFRSPYVFRGMSDSRWLLATSLERLGTPPDRVEKPLLRSLRKYAPRGAFAEDSDWEALAVGQHNGLPTRVLDWSVSPLVAAHFATFERQHFSADGVIWCVNIDELNAHVLPAGLTQRFTPARAAMFDVRLLSQAFPTLEDFDNHGGDACVFFEPPSIEARIASQFGLLSVMNGPAKSHDAYFRNVAAMRHHLVHRIVIHKSAKPQVRDMLDQNNINERMLFPGIPGLCDWLRRYYGPA